MVFEPQLLTKVMPAKDSQNGNLLYDKLINKTQGKSQFISKALIRALPYSQECVVVIDKVYFFY